MIVASCAPLVIKARRPPVSLPGVVVVDDDEPGESVSEPRDSARELAVIDTTEDAVRAIKPALMGISSVDFPLRSCFLEIGEEGYEPPLEEEGKEEAGHSLLPSPMSLSVRPPPGLRFRNENEPEWLKEENGEEGAERVAALSFVFSVMRVIHPPTFHSLFARDSSVVADVVVVVVVVGVVSSIAASAMIPVLIGGGVNRFSRVAGGGSAGGVGKRGLACFGLSSI